MIIETLEVAPQQLLERTGWEIKPQGACKGEICVPLPATVTTTDGMIDLKVLADKLRMPLVHDETTNLWSLGPAAGGKALVTAQAPDFELPDWQGQPFRLSSLHGQKVLLIVWASW